MSGILKEIITLALASRIEGDHMSAINFLGVVACLGGISSYALMKTRRARLESAATAASSRGEDLDDDDDEDELYGTSAMLSAVAQHSQSLAPSDLLRGVSPKTRLSSCDDSERQSGDARPLVAKSAGDAGTPDESDLGDDVDRMSDIADINRRVW